VRGLLRFFKRDMREGLVVVVVVFPLRVRAMMKYDFVCCNEYQGIM